MRVSYAIRNTFQNLNLVVKAFCNTVCKSILKGIKYVFRPASVSSSTLFKLLDSATFNILNPFIKFHSLNGKKIDDVIQDMWGRELKEEVWE